jgi:hypothetical protein
VLALALNSRRSDDPVARRGGAVRTPWASIDFGKGIEVEERPAVEIPTGLGFEGQALTDSSVAEVHKILNDARTNAIVRLDLGTGENWWMTRLFALCVGAIRTGAPELLAFVGRDSGVDHAFLGWIGPRDALRLLKAERVQFRLAFDRAESIGRYITTVAPIVAPASPPPLPPGDPQLAPFLAPATNYAQRPDFQGLGEETSLRVLLDLLGHYEQQQAPLGGERVTKAVLLSVFGSQLRRQKIDVDWPHERQLDEFFAATDDHVAIVQADRFLRIVHRSLLENALLRQLLTPKETVSR